MALLDKIKRPIILKEIDDVTEDINCLNNVIFDRKTKTSNCWEAECFAVAIKSRYNAKKFTSEILKQCKEPMFVMYDLFYAGEKGARADVDCVIITRQYIYITEYKSLRGDIIIDEAGVIQSLIRGKKVTISSPLEQCQRNLEIIKTAILSREHNVIKRKLLAKKMNQVCKSLIVLSDCKSINKMETTPEVNEKYVSANKMLSLLQRPVLGDNKQQLSTKQMQTMAELFCGAAKRNPKQYLDKFKKASIKATMATQKAKTSIPAKQYNGILSAMWSPKTRQLMCCRCGGRMIANNTKDGITYKCEHAISKKCRGGLYVMHDSDD